MTTGAVEGAVEEEEEEEEDETALAFAPGFVPDVVVVTITALEDEAEAAEAVEEAAALCLRGRGLFCLV